MTTTASVLRQIARVSAGLLIAGAIAGQATPAFASEVRPAAQVSTLVPSSDQGVDPPAGGADQGSGQVDLTPGGQVDLTPGAGVDLTPGAGASDSATVTAKDGKVTEVRADSVAYCISVGNSLTLDAGQDVPFATMSRFEVTRSDSKSAAKAKADVTISLASGGEVSGTIGADCDILGQNDVGRFSIDPQDLESVDFHRGGTSSTGSKGGSTEGGSTGSTEGTSSSGGQVDLTPGGQVDLTPGAGASGEATVTAKDGKVTEVRADSVAYCISSGNSLTLDAGQDVPFAKMSRFEVTRSDSKSAAKAKADVTISLTSGGEVSGTIGADCDVLGQNDVGRFSIYPQDLESVDFHRTAK
jgi:hypothetical protein